MQGALLMNYQNLSEPQATSTLGFQKLFVINFEELNFQEFEIIPLCILLTMSVETA